jgi:succinyl-CoA synthetase beta subunit
VVDALEVITRDEQVRAIFFNIFGGITRCDEVARGILQAVGQMSLELRWSSGSTGRTPRKAGRSSPRLR